MPAKFMKKALVMITVAALSPVGGRGGAHGTSAYRSCRSGFIREACDQAAAVACATAVAGSGASQGVVDAETVERARREGFDASSTDSGRIIQLKAMGHCQWKAVLLGPAIGAEDADFRWMLGRLY